MTAPGAANETATANIDVSKLGSAYRPYMKAQKMSMNTPN